MNSQSPCQPSLLLLLLLLLILLLQSSPTTPLRHVYGGVTLADAAFNPSFAAMRRYRRPIKMGDIFFDGSNHDTAERWTRRRCTGASISSRVMMAAKGDTPPLSVSSSSPPVTTSWSSTASSTDHHSTTSTKVRRYPIFHLTNAVSKSFPVPHPDLWTRSLGKSSSYPSFRHRSSLLPLSLSGIIAPSAQIINDVRVEFTDPIVGARQLLFKSGIIIVPGGLTGIESDGMSQEEIDTMDHLVNVLSYFQSIVSPPCTFSSNDNEAEECNIRRNHTRQPVPCVARIVSTIGKVGTKCPRWHADHVPVRLIMSLIGPGCEYVHEESSAVGLGDGCDCAHGESGNNDCHRSHENPIRADQPLEVIVNRFALNNLDEEDTVKANNIIVRTNTALPSIQASMPLESKGKNMMTTIKHAKEGEAVLLMGKGWEEGVGEDDTDRMEEQETILDYDHAKILAAVHRSPKLRPNQERILLTVDLA